MGTIGRRPVCRRYARLLGKNLKGRRGDMSLRDFARRIGISKSELHRMELGEQNVSLSTIELICRKLKCDITELFSNLRTDSENDPS